MMGMANPPTSILVAPGRYKPSLRVAGYTRMALLGRRYIDVRILREILLATQQKAHLKAHLTCPLVNS